jgi:hypothetical protein
MVSVTIKLPVYRMGSVGPGCYAEKLPKSSQFQAYAALVAVWIFWGTTYLAIRMSLESFPPLILISARFILSGLVLLIGAKIAGAIIPGEESSRSPHSTA